MKKGFRIFLATILIYTFSLHGLLIGLVIQTSTVYAKAISNKNANNQNFSDKTQKQKTKKEKDLTLKKLEVKKFKQGTYRSGELVVKYKQDTNPNNSKLKKSRQNNSTTKKLKATVLKENQKEGIQKIRLAKETVLEEAIKAYQSDPNVEYVQPNFIYKKTEVPADPLYSQQWHLQNIKAEDAWDYDSGTSEVVIAIVDTGVDLTHPDLKDNIIDGYNFIADNADPQDDEGHGTHVAGIAAAVSNNSVGVSGLAGNAKIMPIKVLDDKGYGDDFAIGDGIKYAADNGADIINLSLGTYEFSRYMKDAVDYAYTKGSLVIAAAGNDYGGPVNYPAKYPNAMAISATDSSNRLASFSNLGREIEVSAPGQNILSTLWMTGESDYGSYSGTSMATPLVSGLAALILQNKPTLSNKEVRYLIKHTADDLGEPGYDNKFGHGKINALRALTEEVQYVEESPVNTNSDNALLIKDEQTVSTLLEENYSEHWYKFTTTGDSRVDLSLAVPATMDGVMEVYSEDFQPIQTIDFSEDGGSESIVLYLNKPETYYVLVYDFYDRGQSETYSLTFDLTSQPIVTDQWEPNEDMTTAAKIGLNITERGTFMPSADLDFYKVVVPEAGDLKLSLDVPDAIDGLILVLNSQATELLAFADDNLLGEPEQATLNDLKSGTYYVLVADYYGTASPNEYSLDVDFLPYRVPDISITSPANGLTTRLKELTVSGKALWAESLTIAGKTVPLAQDGSFSTKLSLMEGLNEIDLEAINKFGVASLRRQVNYQPLNFVDVKTDYWAAREISFLASRNIINGYDDGTFRPADKVTRAQAVVMLVKALGLKLDTSDVIFTDVNANYWAYPYLVTAVKAGFVSGYNDGSFKPNNYVTRAQMAVMLVRAFGLRAQGSTAFTDVSHNYWAYNYIQLVTGAGVASGYSDGTFRPGSSTTRAQMAVFLSRAMEPSFRN